MKRPRPAPPLPTELLASERFVRPVARPGAPRLAALLTAPAPYAVAMGGLSLQAVWEGLVETGDILCERAFSDWPEGAPLRPQVRLGNYDLIGFSLPYELDWLALPAMLQAGGLPVWARERNDDAPVVIAGGASVTMNPEPLADMTDAFVIGEAEPSIPALTRVLIRERSRQERLAALAELPGIYVPTLPASKPVERLVWDGLAESPRTSLVISPHTAFPDRFLIETGRGCPMGCRFCLARSIYRPVRQARPESLMKAALEGLRVTNRIGLIGAALSGYPDLDELVGDLVDRGAEVSLSSLRADRLSPGLVRALRRGGQDSLTIAPEAGTEALRAAVGKPITDAQLEQAIASAEGEGIRDLKLYFMTNLPGETAEDRRAIVDLAASYAARRAGVRFAVTVSPFVPKPWTPFEGEAFPALREARAALESVTNGLRRLSRVSVRPASARFSAVQAALARGDREVGRAIVAATDKGGSYAALKKALKAEGVDLDQPLLAPEGRPWQRALGRGHVRRSIGGVGREGEA